MKNQSIFLMLVAGTLLFLLAACQSAADPLDGTSWNLVSLNREPPVSEKAPTISFEDGQVGGSSGCNSYGGNYEVEGDKLVISEVASTLMACVEPEGVMEQEAEFLSGLSNAQTFNLTDGQLEILTSDGKILVFNR